MKAHKRKAKENWYDFSKYSFIIFVSFMVVWFGYVFIEIFPTGNGLSKSDWLLFTGSFLSFAGTTFLGLITVRQVHYQNERIIKNRHLEISPVFVITPLGINKQIPGIAKPLSLNGSNKENFDNFQIEIRNEGKYTIRNIYILDSFVAFSLNPSETKTIVGAFAESQDLIKYPKKVNLFDYEYSDKDVSGYPSSFFILYEDIDGDKWYQYFTLSKTDIYFEYDRIESI